MQGNSSCNSNERSSDTVTTPGGSSMVLGRASRKWKMEHAADGERDMKRPCFQNLELSFKTTENTDCGLMLSNKARLKPCEVRLISRPWISDRLWTTGTHARQGLGSPSQEAKKSTEPVCGTPGPSLPCPLPDRGRRKDFPSKDLDMSPTVSLCRKQGMHAKCNRSLSRRATHLERGEKPFISCNVVLERIELPHTSNCPLVRVAPGMARKGTDVSPPAGSCFPDSPMKGGAENSERGSNEDSDLSDPELDPWASVDVDNCTDSEDEPLLSLKEMLDCSTHLSATPEKGTISEPDSPIVQKLPPLSTKNRCVSYNNTLEQMLKEKGEKQRSKDAESTLLLSLKEDLQKPMEDSTGAGEEVISLEQRAVLKRYSLVFDRIPDLHPGEKIFTLSSGRLFTQQSLDLRSSEVTAENAAFKDLLQELAEESESKAASKMAQLLSKSNALRRAYKEKLDELKALQTEINAKGDELRNIYPALLKMVYRASPCPAVTDWLFQMMSVHLDQRISTQILQLLKDISLIAADKIMMKKGRKFEVWTPSIQEVVVIFLNMGASFSSLFPLEALQPPFSEADILQEINCSVDVSDGKQENGSFPEHCFTNVIKYLAQCMALSPRAYSDKELQLLLTMVCRVTLDTRLRLLPRVDTYWLLYHLLNNTRDWDSQLPGICLALTHLMENHHNLCWLVQLLPDHERGKQLRKHLSVSIISKLLNQRCTYKPVTTEFQLSALQQYLPRMRPSSLLSTFFLVKKTEDQGEDDDSGISPDWQAYYLCYSLLALVNEASQFNTFSSNQKDQLQLLSAELEKHIKSDIREGDKWLYRSKVKDFVARIYTRWQILLHKTRPMQGKLHDYWQPLPEDMLPSSQECLQGESETIKNIPEPQKHLLGQDSVETGVE